MFEPLVSDLRTMASATELMPAAFIDRDGTLIEEVNFLSRVEDLEVFPYTANALELLKTAGFRIVVVTNQSGIGRKLYDEAAMHRIHEEMQRQLGGMIDGFFFCPHLPGGGCECRKPNLGMIRAAEAAHGLELSRSWMIGDKDLDVMTGRNAGMRSAMVLTGYGRQHSTNLAFQPEVVADDLLAAVRLIVEDLRSSR